MKLYSGPKVVTVARARENPLHENRIPIITNRKEWKLIKHQC